MIFIIHLSYMKSKFLFIYGTLLRALRGDMFFDFEKHLRYVSPAIYQGKMYEINTYPGVVPSFDNRDVVKGEVYEVYDLVYLTEVLDAYEGYGKQFKGNEEYIRRIVTVKLDDSRLLSCWIYLYNRLVSSRAPIHDGDYIRFMNNTHFNSQMRSNGS